MSTFSQAILKHAKISLAFQNLLNTVTPLQAMYVGSKRHSVLQRLTAVKAADDALLAFISTLGISPNIKTIPEPTLTVIGKVLQGALSRMHLSGTKIKILDRYSDGLALLSRANAAFTPIQQVLPESILPDSPPTGRSILAQLLASDNAPLPPGWENSLSILLELRWVYQKKLLRSERLSSQLAHLQDYIMGPLWDDTSLPNLVIEALAYMMTGESLFEDDTPLSNTQLAILQQSRRQVALQQFLAAVLKFYCALRSPKGSRDTRLNALQRVEMALNEFVHAFNSMIEEAEITNDLAMEINVIFSQILSRIGVSDRRILHRYHQGLAAQILCQPDLQADPKLQDNLRSVITDLQAYRNRQRRKGRLPAQASTGCATDEKRDLLLVILWSKIDYQLNPR